MTKFKSKLIRPDYRLKNNLMAFGFETGRGWYPLIEDCIRHLEKFTKVSSQKGMLGKFLTWLYKIFKIYDFEITQVKEKYGLLRIYLSSETDKISEIIERYEYLSEHVCEECGKFETAKIRLSHGWYKTLCEECSKKLGFDYDHSL
jgi:hypothetical protein